MAGLTFPTVKYCRLAECSASRSIHLGLAMNYYTDAFRSLIFNIPIIF
jgi:hypothetical protein